MMGLPSGAMGLLGGMPPTIHNPSATPGINPNPPPGGPLAGWRQRMGGALAGLQKDAPPISGMGMNFRQMLPLFGMNLLAQPQGRNAFGNALQGTMGMVGQMQQGRQRKELLDMRKEAHEASKDQRAEVRKMADTAYQDMHKRFMSDGTLSPRENQALEMMKIVRSTGDPAQYQEALKSLPGAEMLGGTGMQQQMMNALRGWQNDPAMAGAAWEFMSQPRTTVGPDGQTVIMPGMSIGALSGLTGGWMPPGMGGQPPGGVAAPGSSAPAPGGAGIPGAPAGSVLVQKPMSTPDQTATLKARAMLNAGSEFTAIGETYPDFFAGDTLTARRLPDWMPGKTELMSDAEQAFENTSDMWGQHYTYLVSGAQAPEGEAQRNIRTYIPRPGASPREVHRLEGVRTKAELDAVDVAFREGRATEQERVQVKGELERRLDIWRQRNEMIKAGRLEFRNGRWVPAVPTVEEAMERANRQ